MKIGDRYRHKEFGYTITIADIYPVRIKFVENGEVYSSTTLTKTFHNLFYKLTELDLALS
jgi:hypothetical protein